MMSKCREWHLREPKFAKLSGGTCTQTPQEVPTFRANNTPYFPLQRVGISASALTHLSRPLAHIMINVSKTFEIYHTWDGEQSQDYSYFTGRHFHKPK